MCSVDRMHFVTESRICACIAGDVTIQVFWKMHRCPKIFGDGSGTIDPEVTAPCAEVHYHTLCASNLWHWHRFRKTLQWITGSQNVWFFLLVIIIICLMSYLRKHIMTHDPITALAHWSLASFRWAWVKYSNWLNRLNLHSREFLIWYIFNQFRKSQNCTHVVLCMVCKCDRRQNTSILIDWTW